MFHILYTNDMQQQEEGGGGGLNTYINLFADDDAAAAAAAAAAKLLRVIKSQADCMELHRDIDKIYIYIYICT